MIDDTITVSQVLPFAILILEPGSRRNLELFVYKISRLSGSNPVSEPHGQGVIQRLLLSPSQSFELQASFSHAAQRSGDLKGHKGF